MTPMSSRTLIWRSLRFHWRSHLGVLAGATLATAILAGALVVGDSVRHTLRRTALARLGQVSLALRAGDRFFREALAGELFLSLKSPVAPVILARGTAAAGEGDRRAGRVQVVGVDGRFWQLGEGVPAFQGEGVALNLPLDEQQGVPEPAALAMLVAAALAASGARRRLVGPLRAVDRDGAGGTTLVARLRERRIVK